VLFLLNPHSTSHRLCQPQILRTSVLGSNDTFQKLLANVPAGLSQSKIQASLKLDNYVNLQYEIVAKQLTLLRDEAGPSSRVIFLELPQSIYATQKFKLYPDLAALWGYHLIQTWWHIDSVVTFTSCRENGNCSPASEPTSLNPAIDQERLPSLPEVCKLLSGPRTDYTDLGNLHDLKGLAICPETVADANLHFLDKTKVPDSKTGSINRNQTLTDDWSEGLIAKVEKDPALFYSLDLIPRQSALNVADAHSVSRSYGFAGLFGLLSGFGGQGRYERQHDQYDQFTQQEVFASAFGKGRTTFGWTFGPLPGTKRLAPGLRTTYAVLIVPKNTRFVRLKAYGCGYRRREVPKDPFTYKNAAKLTPNPHLPDECITNQEFTIEVPNEGDNFFVDKIYYKPVAAGQRATVEIAGTFSPEIGILVNGTPLQKVVSVGQPMLEQITFKVPDNAGDKGIQGVFELVGLKRLLLSFIMPPDFVGTPQIALVSPSKEAVINSFSVNIADGAGINTRRRLDSADVRPMFYQVASIVQITPEFDGTIVRAQLFGQGFDTASRKTALLINGENLKEQTEADRKADRPLDAGQFRVLDSTLVQAKFVRPKSSPWHIDFYQFAAGSVQVAHATRSDDGPPQLDSTTPCIIIGNQQDDKKKVIALTVKLKGNFFTTAYSPDVAKQNDNVTINAPALGTDGWQFQAVLANNKSFANAVVVLKGLDSPQFPLASCIDFARYAK
jgi:hypothetical protein